MHATQAAAFLAALLDIHEYKKQRHCKRVSDVRHPAEQEQALASSAAVCPPVSSYQGARSRCS